MISDEQERQILQGKLFLLKKRKIFQTYHWCLRNCALTTKLLSIYKANNKKECDHVVGDFTEVTEVQPMNGRTNGDLFGFTIRNSSGSMSITLAADKEHEASWWYCELRRLVEVALCEHSTQTPLFWEVDVTEVDIDESKSIPTRFGIIYKGRWRHLEVAVKVISWDQAIYSSLLREVGTLSGIRHPNIVQFLGACIRPPSFLILTQYLKRGSLARVLYDPSFKHYHSEPFSDLMIRKIASDICKAMVYLHLSQIIHGNLRLTNIMVVSFDPADQVIVQVAEVGMNLLTAFRTKQPSFNDRDTLCYLAPELLKSDKCSFPVDVYAFGVCLYEIITRCVPFGDLPLEVQSLQNAIIEESRPDLPQGSPISTDLLSIAKSCWAANPTDRPTFPNLLGSFQSNPLFPFADQ